MPKKTTPKSDKEKGEAKVKKIEAELKRLNIKMFKIWKTYPDLLEQKLKDPTESEKIKEDLKKYPDLVEDLVQAHPDLAELLKKSVEE